jgi:trans-aconitate 2-methyltransferase
MSSETLKSFASIRDDYAFFEQHASETEATLTAWLPLVAGRWSAVKALDFGAGSGSFTSSFLSRAGFSPESLELTLVEPDEGFRTAARQVLTPFSNSPVQVWPLLDRDIPPTFDLIFSHHVLYYVPNLEVTLRRLVGGLRPGGRMLLVQGGNGNGLNQLVFSAFRLMGESPPYRYSEDTEGALRQMGVRMEIQQVASALDFLDEEASRWKILRFLLGEHLARLEPAAALQLFEPFRTGDRIRFESRDELFVVDA